MHNFPFLFGLWIIGGMFYSCFPRYTMVNSEAHEVNFKSYNRCFISYWCIISLPQMYFDSKDIEKFISCLPIWLESEQEETCFISESQLRINKNMQGGENIRYKTEVHTSNWWILLLFSSGLCLQECNKVSKFWRNFYIICSSVQAVDSMNIT